MEPPATPAPLTAEDEVAGLLAELLRFDTTNGVAPERPAAEWAAARLAEAGITATLIEPERGRTSLVARIPGRDATRAPLLVHGHLDVVPADPAEWSVHPFAGEEVDGYLVGRGAVDMKNMDAMVLAVVRGWARTGRRPARDIVLALVADEESGGAAGARYLVEHHGELFADCDEAIGEVGGFSVSVGDAGRLYLIQTAEKGINWLRLRARGRAGHASMLNDDNAVTHLARAVAAIGAQRFPLQVSAAMRPLVAELSALLGAELDPAAPEPWLARLGGIARLVGATLANTATPTRLSAGQAPNVVPGAAEATIDARYLPGEEQALRAELERLAGEHCSFEEILSSPAVAAPFSGGLVEAMCAALVAEDGAARPVPYVFSGGTDAKAFAPLGIACYGFSPLRLPADLDFAALFHGVDERVPIEGLRFGVRVLDRVLSDG